MILDKSNLNDRDLREFLIEKCSVGYLADYIIKLRNENEKKVADCKHVYNIDANWKSLTCGLCGDRIYPNQTYR